MKIKVTTTMAIRQPTHAVIFDDGYDVPLALFYSYDSCVQYIEYRVAATSYDKSRYTIHEIAKENT